MWLLITCILINVLLGVIFKLFAQFRVHAMPAIVINYFVCMVTGTVVYGKWIIGTSVMAEDWFPYAVLLGGCFISIFNLVAMTVKTFGIMIATIFQKMSLIAPALIGIMMYGEAASATKLFGILLAMASVIIISFPAGQREFNLNYLWIPLITWLGSSFIEVILYYVGAENLVENADIRFVATSFFSAGIFGLFFLGWRMWKGALEMGRKEFLAGIGLGIPNFFSIYLVVLLLSDGWEGSVLFPVNNVAILVLSTLIGILIFAEKANWFKLTGFATATLSIVLIAIG